MLISAKTSSPGGFRYVPSNIYVPPFSYVLIFWPFSVLVMRMPSVCCSLIKFSLIERMLLARSGGNSSTSMPLVCKSHNPLTSHCCILESFKGVLAVHCNSFILRHPLRDAFKTVV